MNKVLRREFKNLVIRFINIYDELIISNNIIGYLKQNIIKLVIKMEKNLKKILMIVFLVIYIVAFFIFLGSLVPFVIHILATDISFILIYNLIFYLCTFIFTLALWFPLVNGIGPKKASIVCISFLIIGTFVLLITVFTSQLLLSGIILGIGFSGTLYLICFILVYNEEKKRIVSCGLALIPSLLLVVIFFQLSFLGVIAPLSTPNTVAGAAEQTDLAKLEIRLSMMIFPIIALAIAIIIRLIEKDVEKQDQIY